LVPNAALLIAAVAIISLSPARIPAPTSLSKVVILMVGLGAMIVINVVLMRRAFQPLERLTRLMRTVDPLEPGKRISSDGGGGSEVVELTTTFNQMLDRVETERREYARRSLIAEEEERRRLARELHDEIGQTITALMLQLGSAARSSPSDARARLTEAAEAGTAVLDDLHRIVRRLRPEALDDLGLVRAVDALADRISSPTSIRVSRKLDPRLPQLSPEEELVVYRVAQESLTNAVRHSGASRVEVSLLVEGSNLVLTVRDDGNGIATGAKPGSGIRGMRERALLIGAALIVRPLVIGGTEVQLSFPVDSGAER
jgi:two-component system sensor histidine kinase UhpB